MTHEELKDSIRVKLSHLLKKPFEELEVLINQIMYFLTRNTSSINHKAFGSIVESDLYTYLDVNIHQNIFVFTLYNTKNGYSNKYSFTISR